MMMNRGYFKLSFSKRLLRLFIHDTIMDYLVVMRKFSYYSNCVGGGILTSVKSIFYKLRYRSLGMKLGFSIGENVFGYGLVIPHYGTIVTGYTNRIGNYAVLLNSTCIADNGKIIGDGLYMSTGEKINSKVVLGNVITVAANSVVNKDVMRDNCLLAGMPAKVVKDSPIWFIRDGETFSERVKRIEELKKVILG